MTRYALSYTVILNEVKNLNGIRRCKSQRYRAQPRYTMPHQPSGKFEALCGTTHSSAAHCQANFSEGLKDSVTPCTTRQHNVTRTSRRFEWPCDTTHRQATRCH